MRSSVLAGALTFAGLSAAFSDSSPWIVASTASFSAGANHDTIQTSDAALKTTKEFLSTCPTDKYVIIEQPGLHYADLAVEGGSPMKELWSVVDRTASKGRFIVPEVVGNAVGGDEIKQFIEDNCHSAEKSWVTAYTTFPALSDAGESRAITLTQNDANAWPGLEAMLREDNTYTLIIIGAPTIAPERTVYEPEFEETVMMDLKRNVQGQPQRRVDNETEWKKLPLFEKYQFFTPGIFMGLLAVLLIGSILTVGIKALASLEVSYGAFEKDMGPAAQKKQQ